MAFQHTAARRRLAANAHYAFWVGVSTHSRPKAAARQFQRCPDKVCFNTQPPEGGCTSVTRGKDGRVVSTHSRPKAAVAPERRQRFHRHGFNTQPPEGGWHQLPRGGLHVRVSTHSRPKAAVCAFFGVLVSMTVSTHSRPKAADHND